MMNRNLLQRQMFKGGGMIPQYYQQGGIATMPETAMGAPNEAMAMPEAAMGSPEAAMGGGMDPNLLMGALENAAEGTGDLEQASDFESMMNQFSGGDKSEEERRTDLASIVGPDDASQTPDSVLALVTPIVQMAMVDEGIAPMAREAMDVPVEGDMAGGIMSMTGAGNEPPENFKLGGEVRRRGDEDPVQYFASTNANRVAGNISGKFTPIPNVTDTNIQNLALNQAAIANRLNILGRIPQAGKARPLQEIFEDKKGIYSTILGDPETQKKRTQADILFDIANTALAFSAPMEGERPGMSAAERLAFAARKTKLFPTIAARARADSQAQQKLDLAALQAAEATQAAEAKSASAEKTKRMEIMGKRINVPEGGLVTDIAGNVIARGGTKGHVLSPGQVLTKNGKIIARGDDKIVILSENQSIVQDGKVIHSKPGRYSLAPNQVVKDENNKVIATGIRMIKGVPEELFNEMNQTNKDILLGVLSNNVKGLPTQFFLKLDAEGQQKIIFGTEKVKGIPKPIFDALTKDEQDIVLGIKPNTEEQIKGIPRSIFEKFPKAVQMHIAGATQVLKPGDSVMFNNEVITTIPPKKEIKEVNGELVIVNPEDNSTIKLYGERKPLPSKFFNVTMNGVTTVVDANTEAGINTIAAANALNTATPGSATVTTISAEKTFTPRAFLLKEDNKVVTSYDNGKTYQENGEIVPIKNAIPISPDKSYDVHNAEKVKLTAKNELKKLNDKFATSANFDERGIPKHLIKDFEAVQKMVLDGTGPWANIRAAFMAIEGFIPDMFIPDFLEKAGRSTTQSRQYLRVVTALGRSALVKNNKFPVREMEFVKTLFPDPEKFFTEPRREVEKLVTLKEVLLAQKVENLKRLQATGLELKDKNNLVVNNSEIDRLMTLLGGYTTTITPSSGGTIVNEQEQNVLDSVIMAP
tara:strand:- start:9212 stop:11992 length:2781 start_codon:yes stop_codon:yes gene_type:complete